DPGIDIGIDEVPGHTFGGLRQVLEPERLSGQDTQLYRRKTEDESRKNACGRGERATRVEPQRAGVGPRDSPLDVFDHVSSERSQELRLAEDDDLRGDALGTRV